MRIKRIVILGHRGFIGARLERKLREECPAAEVLGCDLPETDLTKPADVLALKNLFGKETAVIFLAAIKRQFGDTLQAYQRNMAMTENFCALLRNQPVGRLIYFSSSAVYGEDIHNLGITEETPVCPTSYYGMAKYASERLFWKEFSRNPEVSFLAVRPVTVYGPGDGGNTYGPVKFTQAVIERQRITLWGDGTELREFLYIDDLADIVTRLTASEFAGVINIASGRSYTFCDVLNCLRELTGEDITVDSSPRTKAKVDNTFTNIKLLGAVGPYRFTPLEEGVRALYEHAHVKAEKG